MVRPRRLVIEISAIANLHHSLRSLFKEFCKPLKTNDPQSDFYAFYRRESKEFDREYIDKYDRDLSTSLIFVSCILGSER